MPISTNRRCVNHRKAIVRLRTIIYCISSLLNKCLVFCKSLLAEMNIDYVTRI